MKVARLHRDKLGARLTELSDDQAKYIAVDRDGPCKPDHYRYPAVGGPSIAVA